MNLRAIDHVLSTTRSVRRRLDFERSVDPALIEECIELALQAPTGGDREAWRFVVVTDPERKRGIAEFYRRAYRTYLEVRAPDARPRSALAFQAERLQDVPVLIIACIEGRPHPENVALQVAHYGSILPAAWSLMLALRSRGLGATWTTLHLLHEREVAEVLGIPENVTQTVLLPVGHMRDAVLKPAARRPAREVTYWDQWGALREEGL